MAYLYAEPVAGAEIWPVKHWEYSRYGDIKVHVFVNEQKNYKIRHLDMICMGYGAVPYDKRANRGSKLESPSPIGALST